MKELASPLPFACFHWAVVPERSCRFAQLQNRCEVQNGIQLLSDNCQVFWLIVTKRGNYRVTTVVWFLKLSCAVWQIYYWQLNQWRVESVGKCDKFGLAVSRLASFAGHVSVSAEQNRHRQNHANLLDLGHTFQRGLEVEGDTRDQTCANYHQRQLVLLSVQYFNNLEFMV